MISVIFSWSNIYYPFEFNCMSWQNYSQQHFITSVEWVGDINHNRNYTSSASRCILFAHTMACNVSVYSWKAAWEKPMGVHRKVKVSTFPHCRCHSRKVCIYTFTSIFSTMLIIVLPPICVPLSERYKDRRVICYGPYYDSYFQENKRAVISFTIRVVTFLWYCSEL